MDDLLDYPRRNFLSDTLDNLLRYPSTTPSPVANPGELPTSPGEKAAIHKRQQQQYEDQCLATWSSRLGSKEGSIQFIYKDSNGHETTGKGTRLTTLKQAQDMPFKVRRKLGADSETATPLDIEKAYTTPLGNITDIRNQQQKIDKGTAVNVPYLESEYVEGLFASRGKRAFASVKRLLGDDTYAMPPEACAVAVDIHYNSGDAGARKDFKKFHNSIKSAVKATSENEKARQWRTAADESANKKKKNAGGIEDRNEVRRSMLEGVARQFEAPEIPLGIDID